MAFEPNKITREHIILAEEKINSLNIQLTPSTKWDVIIGGRKYPPKEIMRYAHEQMNGEKIWEHTGGINTNRFIKNLGFEVRKKSHINDPIEDIIEKYKILVAQTKLQGETYKWLLVNQYKGRPDINASNFEQEISSINYANLIYPVGIGVIRHMAKEKPEEYRSSFKLLFDEVSPLQERISKFSNQVLGLYRELVPNENLSSHHDERTIATFLSYFNPGIYPLYKDSFYQKYCKLIGANSRKKGEKYIHYIELLNDFIDEYIENDSELLDLVNSILPEGAYHDNQHKILAQDILYQMLDKTNDEINTMDYKNDTFSLHLNQILFGPPGTGKTYHTIDMAVKIADPTAYVEGYHEHNKEIFDKLIETGQIVFTTFHQSMSYEDFVEGIKPKSVQGSVFYSIEEGVFKQLCKKAEETYSYLITVDNKKVPLTKELLSELYYEASSLLPPHSENHSDFKLKTPEDYEFELFRNQSNSIVVKAGTKQNNITLSLNEITRVLFENKIPFYKSYTNRVIEGFIMKDKVFKRNEVDNSRIPFILIIDEINRGNVSQIFGELITLIEEDKRIGKREAIEVTLPYSKDKFGVPSNLYIIGTMNTADRSVESLDTALRRRFSFIEIPPNYTLNELNREIEGFSLSELLLTINNRLERLLDKDRLIGHSYFMKVNTLDDLKMVFQNNIIPLLQEYFFGDFGKIGLVLGDAFLEENTNNTRFASFPTYDNDYAERRIYRLKNFTAINNEEKEISDNMFKDALTALLNK